MFIVFQPPSMQRVFLHGRDEKTPIRREGNADMRTLPFQFDRLGRRAGPDQRRAIIARNGKALALGRKGDAFDASFLREFLHLAVGGA